MLEFKKKIGRHATNVGKRTSVIELEMIPGKLPTETCITMHQCTSCWSGRLLVVATGARSESAAAKCRWYSQRKEDAAATIGETSHNYLPPTAARGRRKTGRKTRRTVFFSPHFSFSAAGWKTRRNSLEALQEFCWVVRGLPRGFSSVAPSNLGERPYFRMITEIFLTSLYTRLQIL